MTIYQTRVTKSGILGDTAFVGRGAHARDARRVLLVECVTRTLKHSLRCVLRKAVLVLGKDGSDYRMRGDEARIVDALSATFGETIVHP